MSNSVFENSVKYDLNSSVEYSNGAIVSKIVAKNEAGNISLFAFDRGQNLSEHTAPFDALVQLLDGTAKICINKKEYLLSKGDIIIMPANIPHALEATDRFKMLLTMLKAKS